MATALTSPTESEDGWGRSIGPALGLVVFLTVVALVPDSAVLRPKAHWARTALLAAGCLTLLAQGLRGRIRLPWPTFMAAALLVPAVAAAWWILGNPASSLLARDELVRLALIPAAFWIAATSLGSPGARRLYVGALVTLVIPVAALAVAQHLSGSLGLPLDRQERAFSTFGNPVFLGAFLVVTLPVCIGVALFSRGRERWLGAAASGLGLPALLATGSVGSWAALGVALALGATLLRPTGLPRGRFLVGAALALALLAAVAPEALLRERAHTLIWRDTWTMVTDRPAGVGPGQFLIEFPPYASDELLIIYPRGPSIVNDAHSEPLQLLAELGAPGLLGGLVALLALAAAARRVLREQPPGSEDRVLVAAAGAGLVGAVALSFVSPDLRFGVSGLLFGCQAGLLASFGAGRAWGLPGGRTGRVAVASAAVLLAGWLVQATLAAPEFAPAPPPPRATRSATDPVLLQLKARHERHPGDPDVLSALAEALYEAREFAAAAQAFRDLHVLAPGSGEVVANLALAEKAAQQHELAVEHFREALTYFPRQVDLRYGFAYSCWRTGDLRTATIEVEALLADEPEHALARILRERLRK